MRGCASRWRGQPAGGLADQPTLELMKERGAFLVPTLIVFRALAEGGVADGLPSALIGELGSMLEDGQRVIEQAHALDIPMAYGMDLIRGMHRRQLEEFELRAGLVPTADLVRSATITGAKLIRRDHELGRVVAGYLADLIAVRGNPLDNIRVLADHASTLKFIMKGGQVFKSDTSLRIPSKRRAA